MLLTVKKQIEESIEVKTPAYYKGTFGCSFINESGQLVVVKQTMIYVWDSSYGQIYRDEIERIIRECTPCEKADFDKVYAEAKISLDIAAGAVEF